MIAVAIGVAIVNIKRDVAMVPPAGDDVAPSGQDVIASMTTSDGQFITTAQDGGAAAHVVLHHFDLGASRFEVVATGIEGQALAHQGHLALGWAAGPIGEADEFGG